MSSAFKQMGISHLSTKVSVKEIKCQAVRDKLTFMRNRD
jgi:hypothetical protein